MNNIKVVKNGSSFAGSKSPIAIAATLPTVNEKLQKRLDHILLNNNSFAVPFSSWTSQTNNRIHLTKALTKILQPHIYSRKEWENGLVSLSLEKNCGSAGLGLNEDWAGSKTFSLYVLKNKKNTLVEGVFTYAPDRINKLPSQIKYTITTLTAVSPAAAKTKAKMNLMSRELSSTEKQGWSSLMSQKLPMVMDSGVNYVPYPYYKSEIIRPLTRFFTKKYLGTDGKELRFDIIQDTTSSSTKNPDGSTTSVHNYYVEVSRVYNRKTCSQRGRMVHTLQQIPVAGTWRQNYNFKLEWIPE